MISNVDQPLAVKNRSSDKLNRRVTILRDIALRRRRGRAAIYLWKNERTKKGGSIETSERRDWKIQ